MSSRRLRHRRSPFTGIMPPRPARTRPADINYRQLIEQQPAVSYVRTHTADRSSHDVSYVSPHVLILLGYPPDAFYADPGLWLSIIDPDDIARVNEELAHSEHNGAPCSTEYRVLTSDGRTIWVRNHAVLIRDWRGQPQGWHGLLVDISNQKHRERQLVEHSLLDPLTSLPNRTLFLSRLDHALQRARRTRAQVILLFLDLDNFKLINDRFGHDQGDQVLITIAQRIATILRGSDSMTRFGGDEFLVLLDDVTDDAQVEQIVARIQHTLSMPITLANGDVQVTASIGIAACADGELTEATDATALLRHADLAMYWVKQTGKGQSAHYDAALQDVLIEQWQLEHDLRTGLEREEFRLVYQPIHDLNTGRIVACEALVRWDHPGRGQLAPADFLAMAEHSGLAVPLGWWILRRACTHARQWSQELPLVLQPRVSVNLSPRQFQQPHLVDQIVETLRASGLPAAQLELEVLEASILADPARSLLVLDALRDLGVRIVIDHFGIGMASVSLLRQLPIDVLKLDRSLVTRLVDNPCQTTIVGAIIDLARTVDIAVLAEGVETLAQRQAVTQLGCQMAQGYVIAHPVEADQVVTVLSEQPPM